MPSFDVVAKVDLQEVDNAVNQAVKEISTRFDFRNTATELVLDTDKGEVRLATSDDFHLAAMIDILHTKLAKRGVSILSLNYGKVEKASGNRVRQTATLVQGLDKDQGREILKKIKTLPVKVQAQMMDDQVRVTGKKRDDLQVVIQGLREIEADLGAPLQFTNRRD